MSSSKFDQMFKFISLYKYEISENVPDNLKCGKCKNILINAYCVPCGCSYCFDCVNEMLANWVEHCPGKTEDCKNVLISSNHADFRVNKEISNAVIKCPKEMCVYECALINMEEHVCVCEKTEKCPFANVGCDEKDIAREKLNDHCQSANFNHCKILIEIIGNLRNEIDILKANNEKNQLKIKDFEKNLERIDSINDQTKSINVIMFDLFKKSEIMETKINELNKFIQLKNRLIEWQIYKLDEKRNKDGSYTSEYFTAINMQYALQLQLYANGYDADIKGKGCSIYLYVYPVKNDILLRWPFKADVTINMISNRNPNINKSITKYCILEKPIIRNCSEPFNYLYCDLTKDGEMLDNCFIIECFIDFK